MAVAVCGFLMTEMTLYLELMKSATTTYSLLGFDMNKELCSEHFDRKKELCKNHNESLSTTNEQAKRHNAERIRLYQLD